MAILLLPTPGSSALLVRRRTVPWMVLGWFG
jgi:hypothetical protein